MDLKAISYVIAVAEARTITQAARSLFISQPALSQSIRRTETELGVKLFTRIGSTLLLTAAGELLVREGRGLLREREDILHRLAMLSDNSRKEVLRFGISPFYSKYYLPGVFQYFATYLPGIRLKPVEIISTELEELVAKGELDFCFIPSFPIHTGLTYRTLMIEEIFLGVPPEHPFNDYAIATPSGMKYFDMRYCENAPFILQPSQQKISRMQDRIFQHFHISPNVVYETLNWDTIHHLTCCGLGLSFLPETLMVSPVLRIQPNYYRIANIDTTRPYAVAYRHGETLSHSAEQLIAIFSNNLAKLKLQQGEKQHEMGVTFGAEIDE